MQQPRLRVKGYHAPFFSQQQQKALFIVIIVILVQGESPLLFLLLKGAFLSIQYLELCWPRAWFGNGIYKNGGSAEALFVTVPKCVRYSGLCASRFIQTWMRQSFELSRELKRLMLWHLRCGLSPGCPIHGNWNWQFHSLFSFLSSLRFSL